MTELNLARAMVRQLAAWNVKTVYGVTGDDLLPFLDALAQETGIRYIGAAHEAGAAFMASYQAKLTGGLGVCAASAAGTVNLAQGLMDAYMDGAPVLALTGQVATAKIGTPAKQYFHQEGLLGSVSDYSAPVTDAPAGLRLLIRAMVQAITRQTVAHLSVPMNLWSQSVQAEPGPMPALVTAAAGRWVAGDLERAVRLMRQAQRPLLVVGTRGRTARRELRGLVDVWPAAVVTAQEAKGVVPEAWPGVVSGIGEAWTPPLVGEADCVLLIGTASFEEKYLPKTAVIQVETQPWRVNERYLWDSLAGDIPYIIGILADRLRDYRADATWGERIGAARKQRDEIIAADARNNEHPVHPARLMASLQHVVSDNAFIFLDEGAFNHWFDRDFTATGQRALLSSYWRSMGAGLPAAVAAQLCHPERQIVALAGDGGLLMSLGELATAVKYGLAVKVVVVNNSVYGLEVDKTVAGGYQPQGLETGAPDFSRVAQAFGAQGFRVDDPAQVEETLRRAFSHPGPALVDVVCRDVRLPDLR